MVASVCASLICEKESNKMKKETQTRKVEDKKERRREKKPTQGAAPALNICVYNDLQHE